MGRISRKNRVFQQKNIQLVLPREERIAMIQNGLTQLSHQLGLMAAQEMLAADVTELCGPKHQRLIGKAARRWGSQAGVVTIAGRKVAMQRPRARRVSGGEAELESYRYLQSPQAMPDNALRLLLRGVSCRDYESCLEPVAEEGFGTKRSSVSRHFVKATAKQMRELAERRFDDQKFVAIFMDGVSYGGEMLVTALGVTEKGDKIVLGLRQGATENATVCKDLLTDLRDRGLDTDSAVLCVLDGSKALTAAVKAIWGNRCLVQRCQQHKIRNVLGYLAEKYHDDIRGRMSAAYASKDWHDAEERLLTLVTWLKRINADAAASLREGLEETLTVQKLGLPAILAKSLNTTNPIESVFSVADKLKGRVKRWRQGNMKMRWATAGVLKAEARFNRLKGFREIPILQEALRRKVGNSALDHIAKAA
jgi:transposase-like protein